MSRFTRSALAAVLSVAAVAASVPAHALAFLERVVVMRARLAGA